MEKVADVLDRKYPQSNSVSTNCLVSDALYQMCCENVDCLNVFDNDKFIGIITEHDIASKVLFDDRALNQIMVKEFVNRTLPVGTSEDTLDQCILLMERYNTKHMAIFDNFIFKGVVSSIDLMQRALLNKGRVGDQLPKTKVFPWFY